MTKRLQELFELPTQEKEVNEYQLEKAEIDIVSQDALSNLEKIETALPRVRGLESSDIELDELANMATGSYKDLMELGLQVDSRFSAEIFGVASNLLNHAITAKTAKINKKLKMIELQLKKASLDQKIASKVEEVESTPLGEGKSLDRNELLKILANKNSE